MNLKSHTLLFIVAIQNFYSAKTPEFVLFNLNRNGLARVFLVVLLSSPHDQYFILNYFHICIVYPYISAAQQDGYLI